MGKGAEPQPGREAAAITCITQASEIEELAAAWDALHARSSKAHLFQSHAWVSAWLRHRPEGRPRVYVARRGDRLTAALALCAHQSGRPPFGVRTLRVATDYSDFCDALADPEHPADLAALWTRVLEEGGWHLIDLHYLAPDSHLMTLVQRTHGPWRVHRAPQDVAPYLDLRGNWRDTVSKGHRSDWMRRRRRLEEQGPVTLTRIQTLAAVDALLEEFARLHIERWQGKGETSAYRFPESRAFLRDVCQGLLRRDQLYLYRLAAGDATVSIGLYALFGRRLLPYSYTFAPEFARFCPVHLLILAVVEEMERLGLADVLDFGRGDEEYKLRWTQAIRPLERAVIARRSPIAQGAYWWATAGKPRLWRHQRLHALVREARNRLRLRRHH
ncbi:MAG: GNAT family N-acetyltransferase [Armatimonadetes bacterium]|nr:GNAT family N-acetyltransferase [Armatimonadota bacterium]